MEPKIFRAYDIRGIYPGELDEGDAYAIGRALAIYLKPKTVVVGYDIRSSSPALSENLIRGITDQGTDVVDIGLATTPMVYFAVTEYGFDGGVSITASHNSREFNGFKIVDKKAIPFNEETGIKEIRRLISKNNSFIGDSAEPMAPEKGKISQKEVLRDYLKNIFSFVGPNQIAEFKIVADAGNGMAGLILPELFNQLKCQVVPLFWKLDGSFPNHLPDPAKDNLKDLIDKVKSEKADLGVAFDGDADRIIFVDEKGEIIPSDYITALMAKIFLANYPGSKIVCDLRMSWLVRDVIRENGGQLVVSRVGHSFIKEKMHQEQAVFAGELSGHYYLGANDNFESAFIIMLLLLKLMSQQKEKISKIIKPLKKYHNSGELNFEVEDREEALKRVEAFYEQGEINRLDGLTVKFEDWWFNLRLSNTEPIIRLVIEAKEKDLMEEKKEELMGMIKGRLRE